jgi:hypothetical protein
MTNNIKNNLNNKITIIHTQFFIYKENLEMSKQLNKKFELTSKVILHKDIYYVIQTNSRDNLLLHNLIKQYIIESMKYQLPKV